MDISIGKNGLKWSKLEICVPRQNEFDNNTAEEPELRMVNKLESLLGRQEDMEARCKVYVKVGRLQHCPTNKP
jgi:hypothetical protein